MRYWNPVDVAAGIICTAFISTAPPHLRLITAICCPVLSSSDFIRQREMEETIGGVVSLDFKPWLIHFPDCWGTLSHNSAGNTSVNVNFFAIWNYNDKFQHCSQNPRFPLMCKTGGNYRRGSSIKGGIYNAPYLVRHDNISAPHITIMCLHHMSCNLPRKFLPPQVYYHAQPL